MKKKLLCGLFLLSALITTAFGVDLYVDGSRLMPDVPPTLVNSRTLVPLRSIFEALDAEVTWDGATNTATAQKGDTTVQVSINNTTAYVNGKAHTLDVPAQLIRSRTMVPARFVSEALHARVLWDGASQTVYIITDGHEALVVEYLDVGQGDSILLSSGGEYMLIDAGDNSHGDDVTDYLRTLGVGSLKYAVGTHPHADHIGGLDDVINAMDVQQLLLPDVTHNTQAFGDLLDAVESTNTPVAVPRAGAEYTLGSARIAVIAAQRADDMNNMSLVLKATYGDTSFLFTGDAETELEDAILTGGSDIRADVLKLGHHGSDTSTGSAFLNAVAPKAAVISCGADNSYGHPHSSTLDKLAGTPVWRTDLNGTIIAMTDGQNCRLTAERGTASAGAPAAPAKPAKPAAPTKPAAPSYENEDVIPSTVYVTPTGKRYHYKASCAGKNAAPATLSSAKSRGLTPCQKCAQ